MKKKRGTRSSPKKAKPAVLNLSPFGMWLLVDQIEYFVDFSRYPWFREAKLSEILHVQAGFETGIYWPDLDLDVSLEALQYPERFPLVANYSLKTKKTKTKLRKAA